MMDEAESRCVDIRRRLARFAKRHPVIKRFLEIPGFGPVYATAFWAIVAGLLASLVAERGPLFKFWQPQESGQATKE